jgi:hypothetical protein
MDKYGSKTYTIVCLTNWLDDFIVSNEVMGLNLVKTKHLELFYLITSMVAATSLSNVRYFLRQTRVKKFDASWQTCGKFASKLCVKLVSKNLPRVCRDVANSQQTARKRSRQI